MYNIVRTTEVGIQLPLKRLPDSSVSSIAGCRQEGHPVNNSKPMVGQLTAWQLVVHLWVLDYCLMRTFPKVVYLTFAKCHQRFG